MHSASPSNPSTSKYFCGIVICRFEDILMILCSMTDSLLAVIAIWFTPPFYDILYFPIYTFFLVSLLLFYHIINNYVNLSWHRFHDTCKLQWEIICKLNFDIERDAINWFFHCNIYIENITANSLLSIVLLQIHGHFFIKLKIFRVDGNINIALPFTYQIVT